MSNESCARTLPGEHELPCTRADPHLPGRGCTFAGVDFADRRHHEHDEEDQ